MKTKKRWSWTSALLDSESRIDDLSAHIESSLVDAFFLTRCFLQEWQYSETIEAGALKLDCVNSLAGNKYPVLLAISKCPGNLLPLLFASISTPIVDTYVVYHNAVDYIAVSKLLTATDRIL